MKSGPELTDDELEELIKADVAREEAFIRRIGLWWWRTYLLLCFLPGCVTFAIDLMTWLERRYPAAPSDAPCETKAE